MAMLNIFIHYYEKRPTFIRKQAEDEHKECYRYNQRMYHWGGINPQRWSVHNVSTETNGWKNPRRTSLKKRLRMQHQGN